MTQTTPIWIGLSIICAYATSAAELNGLRPNVPNAKTIPLLEAAAREQKRSAENWEVFHQFHFTDRVEESGISFRAGIVEDAGKNYKAAHYDHGTGMAVADVDGDGLLDIYFVGQLGGCELWRNTGHGHFENITEAAGVGLKNKICVGASFGDIDNDGLPDLFVTTVRGGNVLFKNLGHGKFKEITEEAGVGYSGHSSGAVFFDFDNDGLLDLFVCNVGQYTVNEKGPGEYYLAARDAFTRYREAGNSEQSILYRNIGNGRFEDVSKQMHLENKSWSGDATVCDVNGDGWPDLYVANMSGDDHYYENEGGKGFVERTGKYFPKTPWGAMGVKFFDYNNDGLLDLYVTDMHSDMTAKQIKDGERNFTTGFAKEKSDQWCMAQWSPEALRTASNSIFGNAFYQNAGQGKFVEVSQKVGAETFWPWGVSVGDVNGDGYEDVFVTAGMGYPLRYASNSLLLNQGGKNFVDAEFVLGVEPPAKDEIETVYFTLDCDGADKNHVLARNRHGQVNVIGSRSSRSSAIFDFDEDGDLDIVTNDFNDRPRVFLSDLSEKRALHFLKIRLVGTHCNRDGLGAAVRVRAGDAIFTRFHDGKSGYLGQSSAPLYFAFGERAKADSIEVVWPGGKKQTIQENIPANGLLTVTEPR